MSFLKTNPKQSGFLLLGIVALALSILAFTYSRSQQTSGTTQGKVQQMKPGARSHRTHLAPNSTHP